MPTLPANLRLGPVHLTVRDLDRAVTWYQRSLGLRVHRHEPDLAELGDGS
jgi:catechol 2,3-dioxygenase